MPKNKVSKLADGRYKYKTMDPSNKRVQISSLKSETLKEFKLRCDELDRTLDCNTKDYTFLDVYNLWFNCYAVNKSITYQKFTQDMYRRKFEGVFDNTPIHKIKRHELIKFMQKEIEKGYALSYLTKIKGIFNAVFSFAIDDLQLNIGNPCINLKIQSQKVKSKKIRVISKEQEEVFFELAKDTSYYNYFRLLIATGLRPSECLGLQWTDIKNKTINIERGITINGYSNLKTKGAKRTIPVTNLIKTILKNQDKQSIWVFPSKSGVPSMNAVACCLSRIINKHPLLNFSLYDFRHTYATRTARLLPTKTLQYVMGHKDISTTLSYYVGIEEEDIDKAINILNANM